MVPPVTTGRIINGDDDDDDEDADGEFDEWVDVCSPFLVVLVSLSIVVEEDATRLWFKSLSIYSLL